GVPAKSLPKDWYGGPGVGATATYSIEHFAEGQKDVRGDPKYFLRVHWQTPPGDDWPGEHHHQPDFRFTFLEYFGIRDVRQFAGQTVTMSFYGRCGAGEVAVIPILWHSYAAGKPIKGEGYELFE